MRQSEKEIEGRILDSLKDGLARLEIQKLNFGREESGHVARTAQANCASRYQRVEFASEFYAGRDRRHDS